MLIRYKLTGEAKRRLFLEGVVPAQSQMLEVDVARLAPDAHIVLRRHGHVENELDARQLLVLEGAYDALTLDELVAELKSRRTLDRRTAEVRAPY